MNPENLLMLASILFAIGGMGVMLRRNALVAFMCVELMLNAANIVFVSFARHHGGPGQILAMFALAITVAEVAVGLAIVVLLYRRHGDTVVDTASEAKG